MNNTMRNVCLDVSLISFFKHGIFGIKNQFGQFGQGQNTNELTFWPGTNRHRLSKIVRNKNFISVMACEQPTEHNHLVIEKKCR